MNGALETLRLKTQEATGLLFRDPDAEFEARVTLAGRDFGFVDAETFALWLLSDRPSRGDQDRWIGHISVGETYFWREAEAFDALEHTLLPALAARAAGPLKIWSAGCSTGEEAYSLAIAVTRSLGRGVPLRLFASDLNVLALEKARTAVYGAWSFRNAPSWLREDFFLKETPDRWKVRDDIRGMVRFLPANLLQPVGWGETWDLILCRNVLMYFSPERIRGVLASLYPALAEGGALLVSASELSLPQPPFRAERIGSTQVFRRGA